MAAFAECAQLKSARWCLVLPQVLLPFRQQSHRFEQQGNTEAGAAVHAKCRICEVDMAPLGIAAVDIPVHELCGTADLRVAAALYRVAHVSDRACKL